MKYTGIQWFSVSLFLLFSSSSVANNDASMQAELSRQIDAVRQSHGKTKKVSANLRELHDEFVAFKKSKGEHFKASNKHLKIDNEKVLIEVIAASDMAAVQRVLQNLGGTHLDSVKYLSSGYLPISAIPNLESIPFIRSARPSFPVTQAGLVTSQGDVAARADNARSLYGIDGSGVAIGTMSDSFDCLGQAATDVANDDLPAGISVQEISSCGGATDEGRAMMQIIHDLAPGSTQMFHSGTEGPAAFANGIRALANAGADIIVDDVLYLTEPFFQDGPITQAINEVTAQHGVVYLSAAANNADQSYESVYRENSEENGQHDFDPGPGEDVWQSIFIPAGETIQIS